MVNTEIRLIIFFAAKDGEALHSQLYTVEVRNRFKGLDLIDGVPDELWNEVRNIVQQTGIKTIPILFIICPSLYNVGFMMAGTFY